MQDNNEIPLAITMFLASGIITGLIQTLFHVGVCHKCVVYIRLQAAIFDVPLTP